MPPAGWRTGIKRMGKIYGYIRVSSIDQNESRQRMAMHKHSIAEKCIYTDKISGKDLLLKLRNFLGMPSVKKKKIKKN